MRRTPFPALLTLAAIGTGAALGADPPKPADRPAVRLVLPWSLSPGQVVTLNVRGLKLDRASAVRFTPPLGAVKLAGHGKAAVPNGLDAKLVGDTEAVVEVSIPAAPPRSPVALVVVTPEGETEPYPLTIEGAAVTLEREPNGGFREAQPVAAGATVDGRIERPQDVDVYRLEGRAGDRLTLALMAARRGSALEPLLSLYDEKGRLLAETAVASSSVVAGADASLEVRLPATGSYRAVVMDAQDRGGPLHPYRLTVRNEPDRSAGRSQTVAPSR